MKSHKLSVALVIFTWFGWNQALAQADFSYTESSLTSWQSFLPDMGLSGWLLCIAVWFWLLLVVGVRKMIRTLNQGGQGSSS